MTNTTSKAAPATPPTVAPAISLAYELFWFELGFEKLFWVTDGVADVLPTFGWSDTQSA
jgi:hypothetical protein